MCHHVLRFARPSAASTGTTTANRGSFVGRLYDPNYRPLGYGIGLGPHRFIEGMEAIVAIREVGGFLQLQGFDIPNEDWVVATTTPWNKMHAFAWRDPQHGMLLLTTRLDAQGEPRIVEIYHRQGNGTFGLFQTIPSPARFRFVVSPEPFVAQDGTSYISWLASDEPFNYPDGESEAWIARVDGATGPNTWARPISPNWPGALLKDPEPFTPVGGPTTFIYFLKLMTGSPDELWRCDTGL